MRVRESAHRQRPGLVAGLHRPTETRLDGREGVRSARARSRAGSSKPRSRPAYDPEDARHYLEFKLGAVPAAAGVSDLRESYATPLWLLLAISGLVLLIACANLANLMVARAGARQPGDGRAARSGRLAQPARPPAARRKPSRSRLIGAVSGAALAQVLSRALVSFLSTQNAVLSLDLAPDWRVFGFTAGLALLTCILFGVGPGDPGRPDGARRSDEGGRPRHDRPAASGAGFAGLSSSPRSRSRSCFSSVRCSSCGHSPTWSTWTRASGRIRSWSAASTCRRCGFRSGRRTAERGPCFRGSGGCRASLPRRAFRSFP